MLNDQQKAVSEEWIQYHIENAEWIGHDNFIIGDANNEIIWNGRQMTISDEQDVEMGIITLEAMPESVEEMQNFQPDFEPPIQRVCSSMHDAMDGSPANIGIGCDK